MRRIWRKAKPKEDKLFRANERIMTPEVFLIDENGVRLGVMPTAKARQMAEDAGLDLVEVNPKERPPVVKIMDHGQFKYEREKKAQKQKSQQKKVDTKGLRLSVRISEHDFNFRLDQAKKFLERGDKLKLELILKGRERQHPQKAVEIIRSFVEQIEKTPGLNILREQDLTRQDSRYTIILANQK
jgi:translation initiation factor IF-3